MSTADPVSVSDTVCAIVAEALGCDPARVRPEASMMHDLGGKR